MKKSVTRSLSVWILSLSVIVSAPRMIRAEEEIVPPSFASARISQVHQTGDFELWEPDVDLQILNSSEEKDLAETISQYTRKETSLLRNKSDYFYYYQNISPIEREIYDIILQMAEDPVEDNPGVMLTTLDPADMAFWDAYFNAFIALTYDHPELFWLYNTSEADIFPYSTAQKINGRYTVFFKIDADFEAFEEQMTAFNNAVDAFLADIDTSRTEYEIIKQIHDKLIHLVTYDNETVNDPDSLHNLGHTAYGALVANSFGTPNHAVCDGYSLAFEYLLQQCGIRAVLVGGMAGFEDDEMGGHAWNLVQIDGVWYEADSTWDDMDDYREMDLVDQPDSIQTLMLEAISDSTYWSTLEHYLFLISTESISNVQMKPEYYFRSSTGYEIPFVSPSRRIRQSEIPSDSEINPQANVIALAPEALYDFVP